MEYEIELYEKIDGKTPVLEFILSLDPKQQAKIYIVKKKQKTPKKELNTALDRMKEYLRREK